MEVFFKEGIWISSQMRTHGKVFSFCRLYCPLWSGYGNCLFSDQKCMNINRYAHW